MISFNSSSHNFFKDIIQEIKCLTNVFGAPLSASTFKEISFFLAKSKEF